MNLNKAGLMDDDTPFALKPRRPRGPALSAERIATKAMALVDQVGLEAFSFRTLAAALGCQAMSIYHYYPSKAHLYEALVDICIAEVMTFRNEGTWQDRLRGALNSYRRMAMKHPGFFLFFGTFRLNNRAGMGFLNRILQDFEATGLGDEARARHFRVIGYYLVGACLDETMGYAKGPSATTPVPTDEARRDFPAIMAVGPYFGPDRHELVFQSGIDLLVAGIEAELSLPRP